MLKLASATPVQRQRAAQQVGALGYNIFNDPFGNKRNQAFQEALRVEQQYDAGPTPTVEQFFSGYKPTMFGTSRPGLGAQPTGGTTGDGKGGAKKDKVAESLARRTKAADELLRSLKNAAEVAAQDNEVNKLVAQQAKERSDIEAKIVKLREGGTNKAIEDSIVQVRKTLQTKQTAELEKKIFDLMEGIGDKACSRCSS